MIKAEGSLTKSDFDAARGIHMRKANLMMSGSMFVAALIFLFLAGFNPSGNGVRFNYLIGTVVLIGLPWLLNVWLKAIAWRRCPKQIKINHRRVITENGIEVSTATGSATFLWSDYIDRRVTDRFVMLYPTANVFVLIPRHHFKNDADWNQFVELVTTHVRSSGN